LSYNKENAVLFITYGDMNMRIIAYIEEFNIVSVIVRLMLSTFAGAVIGLERRVHGKSAGVKTFSLVCLGASLVMVTNEFLMDSYPSGDVARLGAQVISGVGFLGVGTIIITGRNYVKGLTTAASLWTTACLGIAFGSGYIAAGLIALLFVFLIMTVLSGIGRKADAYTSFIHLYLEISKDSGIDTLYEYVKKNDFRISSINKQKKLALNDNDISVLVEIDLQKRINHALIIEELGKIEAIHYLEEVH
jgi:putative Mg2+ transporter-C (MgtC) family protein